MAKRKLPEWIIECAAKYRRLNVVKKARNFIHVLDQAKTTRIRENAKNAILILSMSRNQRAHVFGELLEIPFHFTENNGVMCVMDLDDVLEVIVDVRGNNFIESDDFQYLMTSDSKMLMELRHCLDIYNLQRSCIS